LFDKERSELLSKLDEEDLNEDFISLNVGF